MGLWLLLHQWITKSVEEAPSGPIKSLYELGLLLGKPAIIAALSFVAYVLGSMLLWKFNSGRFPSRSPFIISLGRWLGQRVSPIRVNVMTSQLRTYLSGALRETKYELSAGDHEKILRRVLDTDLDHDLSVPLELSYAHVIYDELDAVGIQLQARNRDFWDTYDRQTAEADFRIGIAPPLLLIVVLMAMQLGGHLWWLVLILAPIYLVVLGLRNALEATATLVQAVVLNMVEPPVLERLREALAERKEEVQKPAHMRGRR